ncbi:MAG: c-type cytochrome [Gammaproteobacteria bacterium]|jgi:cytochrome c5
MKKIVVTLASALVLAGMAQAGEESAAKKIYDTKCMACHASGVAGAPKLGDKQAWAPRIESGMDTLMNSVMNGKNAMPPKGTCMECSEEDLRATVEYMIQTAQ